VIGSGVVSLPRHASLLSLLLVACGPSRSPVDPQADESTSSSTSATSSETSTSTTESSGGFVPDWNRPMLYECDVFAQDCDDGEKCVPYSSVGSYYDGSKCVPVTGDQAHGEPCSYGGSALATDDCDENSGCWDFHELDGEQLGICHAFCTGTADDPHCPAGSSCSVDSSGTLAFCVITCDPVAQDCGPGLGCYWANAAFECTFTTQNIPAGEPCGLVNDCAPGLLCASSELLPTCSDTACCTRFCYLSLGDSQCDATPGTVCVSFFEEGMSPPGEEDIGVCIVPAP
jgi:hypothetical protein